MGSAVEQYEKGEFIDKHTVKQHLSFLTHQQRVAVQKRVATLNRLGSLLSLILHTIAFLNENILFFWTLPLVFLYFKAPNLQT